MENKSTSIAVDDVSGIPNGAELVICKGDKFEKVKVTGVSTPTYKHKSKLHEFIFNLTSKFLLFGWPQPKVVKGGTIDIERPVKYLITEVWKTGERPLKYNGKKPQGYNIYCNGIIKEFLPYGN
jgi:hypothetical protein